MVSSSSDSSDNDGNDNDDSSSQSSIATGNSSLSATEASNNQQKKGRTPHHYYHHQQHQQLYIYEQLGVPINLYRHKPSYTTYTTSNTDHDSIPRIPAGRINIKHLQQKYQAATKISCHNTDTESLYPPQPWSRRAPGHSLDVAPSQVVSDSQRCVDIISKANRDKKRRYLQHLQSMIETGSIINLNNDNNTKSSSFDRNHNDKLNNIPYEKKHYIDQKNMYDREYMHLQLPLENHLLQARGYRLERMHSSPMEGYCTPFSRMTVRYGFGDEREYPLSRSEEIKKSMFDRKVHKQHLIIVNDDVTSLNNSTATSTSSASKEEKEEEKFNEADDNNDDGSSRHSNLSLNQSEEVNDDNNNNNDDDDTEIIDNAPFTLKKQNTKTKSKTQKRKRISQKLKHVKGHINQNVRYHGNCISLIPCLCNSCLYTMKSTKDDDFNNDSNKADPNIFVIHPTGECISSSCLIMPNGIERVARDEAYRMRHPTDVHVDVGGKILQIDNCFDTSQLNFVTTESYTNFEWWFLVRTAYHCSVIVCKLLEIDNPKRHNENISTQKLICSGIYELKEVRRIDLKPHDKDGTYYELLHMTTNRQSPASLDSLTYPSFAVVTSEVSKGSETYHQYKRDTNTIHHVQISDKKSSRYQKHSINNIGNVDTIEFSRNHPMVLWSAASSKSRDLYFGKNVYQRPMLGFGNELYAIDLRIDKAQYLWGPSQQDFLVDGIHSISGILSDPSNPYLLHVKSISAAGRMFEIDARMPCRVVTTWCLPGLCDDFNSYLSPNGVYGCGSLITRPIDLGIESVRSISTPIICVDKSPGSYGIQLYQRPRNRPRFQTQNLEMPMTTGLGMIKAMDKNNGSCFASSCSFPITETNSLCGIAAFYRSTASLLTCEKSLKNNDLPKSALCFITASSVGDLNALTLVVSPYYEERRSNIIVGESVGSCAVAVPPNNTKKGLLTSTREQNFIEQGNLLWTLENTFQPQSKAILKHHVASRSQCRNFETVQLRHIPFKTDRLRDRNNNQTSIIHPFSETFISHSDKDYQSKLKINTKYVKNIKPVLHDNERKTNTVIDKNVKSIPNNYAIDLNKGNIQSLKGMWSNIDDSV